jgi:hypothetical protein
MAIEPMPVASLRPYRGNARTHSNKPIRQIADSIRVSAPTAFNRLCSGGLAASNVRGQAAHFAERRKHCCGLPASIRRWAELVEDKALKSIAAQGEVNKHQRDDQQDEGSNSDHRDLQSDGRHEVHGRPST